MLVALNYECNIAVKRFSAHANTPFMHRLNLGQKGTNAVAVVMPGLERRLKAELSGDVQFDRFTRGRYATDASHYQIMPVGVVAPRTIEEAERAIGIARSEGVTVLARGGGTSQAGQTVGDSLVVDCSKYLTRILDLDVEARALHGRARHRARRSQPSAQAARPVVSGRHLDRLARHHRRHGRQQFLRRPLDALRHHARQCHVDRGGAGRRHAGAFRPHRRQRRRRAGAVAAARQGSARHRRARSRRDRGALPQGAAPRRRLQSRRAGAWQERHQPRAHPGRLGGHARLFDPHRTEAVAAARPPRRRRLPFRQLPRGDERGAAHRAAAADRGRTDRPHHDRAGARDPDFPSDAGQIRARDAGSDPAGRVRRGRPRGKPAPPAAAQGADRRSRLRLGQAGRQMGRRRRGAQRRTCRPRSPRCAPPASTS